ncbi:FAD-dependent oxidoreductase [Microbacterium sp. ISL-103]|uniref:NAD(P)/FAD-dependent oxidoreductase n=1 Tax=Microbacterium sp. ISL-103 TaxID=2819156 RepID=UPI001BEB4B6E|nr:FAD-binding oxidoreductase [Microbacterium sp. ISL-103]MBT2475819.1 FAD-dependent oxidoreductase [Microbacterium sp. ISL-103]
MSNTPAYGHELQHDPAVLHAAVADAAPRSFWLDDSSRPESRSRLTGTITADLAVVGGGYAGLWTALIAKERHPDWEVVLVEARTVGWAASGRNGGFVEASLTHGPENGELHFAKEMAILDRLAEENFNALSDTIHRYNIDAEFELEPTLTVATEPHQVADMKDTGEDILEGDSLAAYGRSPLFRAGRLDYHGNAFVHPAKLAWGLAETAETLGVKIFEHTRARKFRKAGDLTVVRTRRGQVRARRVALATNGFPSLLKRLRLFTVPIYDYVLMTEPLSEAQLDAIGWTGRHGITDSGREFHYYRKTADNRILFGGYDAVYHRGRKIRDSQDQRPETFERLADHFFSTFPQLEGIRFSHKWGGMIDMSTQLVAFHGATRNRRIAYSAGYTGLGVAATRFGAETMLDFLEEADTERTRLRMSRRLPIPVPPEPIAYPLIQMMRRAVAKSDANGGKDGLLLKLAGLFGVGFDS